MNFVIQNWYAWGPGVDGPDEFTEWTQGLREWGEVGSPDVRCLPANERRRLSRHSKIALNAAFSCLGDRNAQTLETVFASRHGEHETTVRLLNDILSGQVVSPIQFSGSVHNTASGLFSIAATNRRPTVSIAAGRDTFCCALIEAAGRLVDHPEATILVVMSDEPLPAVYTEFSDEKPCSYAVALLLAAAGTGIKISGHLEGRDTGDAEREVEPQALQFLRWLQGDNAEWVMTQGRRRWRWVME